MITLGSPCKRHEVLVRVGVTRIAKQEVLPRVEMTRIGKQGVMARVGRTRIVMHGRLPRGKSALDRELAIVLVGLGVWLDIESDRAGYTGEEKADLEEMNEPGNHAADKAAVGKNNRANSAIAVKGKQKVGEPSGPVALVSSKASLTLGADDTEV
ncbi:hypothetical protein LWI29_025063 [Acer saccharum]|uniref:Uncharacterized protein n=1 Tax=Acer saccharum TaxID=4024 RepID=A0AA39RRC1_ACESA|nr:hypothetical protein LWI29_025063 [Acer saccharum]